MIVCTSLVAGAFSAPNGFLPDDEGIVVTPPALQAPPKQLQARQSCAANQVVVLTHQSGADAFIFQSAVQRSSPAATISSRKHTKLRQTQYSSTRASLSSAKPGE